jgi:hypothetical protein
MSLALKARGIVPSCAARGRAKLTLVRRRIRTISRAKESPVRCQFLRRTLPGVP